MFETAKITQEGGAVPEGTESWETFWFAEGNFDAVTGEWNEDQDEFTATFPDEGLYTVQAALGVGNYVLTADIPVRVLEGETLDAGLEFSPRYETVWTGGVTEEYIGSVDARNMTIGGDGYDYTWAIEPISGDEVADVFFNEDAEDIHGVPVHFQLKSGAGTVRYRVTYSAMDGLIQGSCEVSFEVAEGDIEGLPAGIGYEPSSAQLEPGESFTFNMDQITVDGSVPRAIPSGRTSGPTAAIGTTWARSGARTARCAPGRLITPAATWRRWCWAWTTSYSPRR